MSFNFNTNGNLFCEGETFVIDGANKLKEIIDDITSIKIPSDFDKNSIFSLKDNLNTSLKKANECLDTIYRTKEQLLKLDNGFYESYMSSFNSNNTLSKMNDNEKLNFMNYLMHLVESYDSLDENTKMILLAYLGDDFAKINYSGIFKNFTDFQNICISYFSDIFYKLEQDELNVEGKTVKELLCVDKYTNDDRLNKLFKCGYGDIKIVEICKDKESGFSSLVLQDKEGNYMIHFNCTETEGERSEADMSYDVALTFKTKNGKKILKGLDLITLGFNLVSVFGERVASNDKLPDSQLFGGLIKDFGQAVQSLRFFTSSIDAIGKDQLLDEGLDFLLEGQRKLACELTQKYINSVRGTNNKISISGFSLGGSLSEQALLYCDKYGKNYIDKAVIYNPIHNDLSKKEVEILKSYGDRYQCYVAQGDMVSGVSNYEDLKDTTRYLNRDYKKMYEEVCNQIMKKVNGIGDILQFQSLLFGRPHSFWDIGETSENINNNFDERGNYKFGATPVSINACLQLCEESFKKSDFVLGIYLTEAIQNVIK